LDYKFCPLQTIDIWRAFLASSDSLVKLNFYRILLSIFLDLKAV